MDYQSFPRRDSTYFAAAVPLVRAELKPGLLGTYFRIAAIYADQIVTGWCKYLESVHEGPLEPQALASRLYGAKITRLTGDSRVEFSPGNGRRKRARFRVVGPERATFWLPNYEIEHPLSFLRAQLGERLTVRNRVSLNSIGLALLGLAMLAIVAAAFHAGGDTRYAAIPAGMLAATLLAVFFYDQCAAAPPWAPAKNKKIDKDLSGRQPFRSRPLGLLLKFSCAAILLASIPLGQVVVGILLWPVRILALLGLYYGHALSQRKPEYVRAGDTRPPVLYLRSFLDDRRQTLVTYSRWAIAAGILPPRMLPAPWSYIFLFNPARVLRVLFNRSVDTSEEQIGLCMRQLGPFVAIGQPGDTFAAPGAARMYVSNDEWKAVVDSYLAESKYIVLQPASTEGVWWEVERVLKNVPLEKILFCMVNFHLHQNDYEAFQLRINPLLPQPISVGGGLTTTPAFLFFDAAGAPRLVPTSYHTPLLWPWRGNAADLDSTLKPFLVPAAERPAGERAPRPRGMSAGSHFAASCAYFGVLMLASLLPLLIPAVRVARDAAHRVEQQKRELAEARPAEKALAPAIQKPATAQAPAVPAAQTPLDKLVAEADDLYTKKDLPALEQITARMIAEYPDEPRARFYRGLYFKLAMKLDEALGEFEKGTKLSPAAEMSWSLLGQTQIDLKQFAAADASFTKAIELKPEQASFYFNRGFARFHLEQYEGAAADFARTVELKPPNQADACAKCGLALQRSSKIVESLRYFNSAVQMEPKNVEYKMWRAQAFEALGSRQFTDGNASEFARAGFDDVLKLTPESAPARFGRALALQRLGKHVEAIEDFDALLKNEPKNDLLFWRRGLSQLQAGHYQLASADFQQAIDLDPKDPTAVDLLIRTHVAQAKLDEALSVCEQRLQADPSNVDILSRKAILLFLADRPSEAVPLREQVAPQLLDNPRLNQSILGMMLVMQSAENPELIKRAIAKAEQLVASNPTLPMLVLLNVALKIRLEDFSGAATSLHALDASQFPEMPLSVYQLYEARIAAQSTEKNEARQLPAKAKAWFEQNCPTKFEENQPESLGGDWTSRVLLGKFYRDLLPVVTVAEQ